MDSFKNFAKVTVSTGYDAAATSIALTAGHGTRLPTAPFNATWYNSTDYADPTDDPNVEIVRVTAIASDTLTVTRGQESITASTKNTASKTYKMIAGLTAKTLNTDIGASTGIVLQDTCGRLTLESGVAISLTDQSAKTTIYFTPYKGNRISLYSGTAWELHAFAELSLPLGTLTADKNYDVFVYDNAGTITLELSAAWTSNIARASALTLQDGIYVKSGATTRRYLGTFRTVTTTTTEDTLLKRFVRNYHHAVPRDVYLFDATAHAYSGMARQWNGNAANQIGFVVGLAESTIAITLQNEGTTSTAITGAAAGAFNVAGLGLDSTTLVYRNSRIYMWTNTGAIAYSGISAAVFAPQIGYHYIAVLESSENTTTNFSSMALSGTMVC